MEALLLNSTYECIAFIPDKRAFKLMANNKVEVLSSWDLKAIHGRDSAGKTRSIAYPAVLKLINHRPWIPKQIRFNRSAVFRRDGLKCQYCGEIGTTSKLTIDHVIPMSAGGTSCWRNCVTACFDCNNRKRNRTPEEAGMPLRSKPFVPILTIVDDFRLKSVKHASWEDYIFV